MAKQPGIAIYDAPAAVGRRISRAMKDAGFTVLFNGPLSEKTARQDADIWLTKWSFNLRQSFLSNFRPRRGLITMSVGTDHIDKAYLEGEGIHVANCPGYCSVSVAEHAIALSLRGLYRRPSLPPLSRGKLAFCNFSDEYAEQAVANILFRQRQIESSMARARDFDYQRCDEPWENRDLSGSTIGIVGKDRKAARLARIFRLGFNCEVLGHDTEEELEGIIRPAFLLDLLEKSDYVFLCTEGFGMMDPVKSIDARELEDPDEKFYGSGVSVLGTGNIGSVIAKIAKFGFDCDVTAFSITGRKTLSDFNIRYAPNPESAIHNSAFSFIALPLSGKTKGIISRRTIGLQGSASFHVLVNVTRDEVVESDALYEAISRGGLMLYGTDVLPGDKSLWADGGRGTPEKITLQFAEHPSVIATPHEADASYNSLERLAVQIPQTAKKILKGERI